MQTDTHGMGLGFRGLGFRGILLLPNHVEKKHEDNLKQWSSIENIGRWQRLFKAFLENAAARDELASKDKFLWCVRCVQNACRNMCLRLACL